MDESDESEVPSVIPGTNEKLQICEVCACNDAKYTCPKCEVRTCSLPCSKIHKKELDCDGIRDKTKFVPLNKFTNLELSSDYRLLEDVTRSMESIKKCQRVHNYNSSVLPFHLFKLKKAAQSRKIYLEFLPKTFKKRKVNTTKVVHTSNTIFWTIEWIFLNAENYTVYDHKISEKEVLSNVITKHLNDTNNKNLEFYKATGLPGITLLLKAERKSGKKFYSIDSELTLQEILRNKVIIEFPTIMVVFKDHAANMDIIINDDSDDENDRDDVKHTSLMFTDDN